MRTYPILLWVFLAHFLSGAMAAERPNVLMIAIDDLNDWLGCYRGHPQAVTPHIDGLAERGIRFTNAHCAAPVCKASRSAIFSGRAPVQTEIFGNSSPDVRKQLGDGVLLPAQFAKAGYTTFGTGKLLHGNAPRLFDHDYTTEQRWSPFSKEEVAYSQSDLPTKGTERPRHVIKDGPEGREWVLPLNGLRSERNPTKTAGESFDWGPVDVADQFMGDARITDWAMEQLEAGGEKPFFMGVGYYRPHIPLFAPKQDFEVYPAVDEIKLPKVVAQDLDDVGPAAKRWALEAVTAGSHELVAEADQWQEAVLAYLACVTFVDRQIGRLLASLEATSRANNTWIVLWSDHGWHLGEKEHWGKWTGWRQSTRVPLIIVPPVGDHEAPRGQVCDEPVSLIDLFPTFIDACGLEPREDLAGVSLVPVLRSPSTGTQRAVLTTFDKGNHALSTKQWRYIRYKEGEEELYDVSVDPNEWQNLVNVSEYKAALEQMRQRMDQRLRELQE